ncbi:MAG: hypothetical protein LC723_03970, partial [Actinobacteria bacterium]|nr:hypothetical protein [Actinomycetota bacterium]
FRIGVPLCANCHWLSSVGSLDDRHAIMASIRRSHPGALTALKEAREQGLIRDEGWKRLVEDGLADEP